MTNEDVRLIKKRIELVKVMKKDGKSEEEIYIACRLVKSNELIAEIRKAEKLIEENAKYYHSQVEDIPTSFQFICFLNHWESPFVALNELLKRIDTNQQLLKREEKRIGIKSGYKSRYKEMRELLQKEVNKHD